MLYCIVLLLNLFSVTLLGMENKHTQLEFCLARKVYDETRKQDAQKEEVKIVVATTTKPCVFCDKKILSQNFILSEDDKCDVRYMMNKFPYMDFDQGPQILIMPLSHKEHPREFSFKELANHVDAVQKLSAQLYEDAYTQECFNNWGAISGQSVPHWHTQFKNFVRGPKSLPETMEIFKNPHITTIEDAFKNMQMLLQSRKDVKISPQQEMNDSNCNCCAIKNNENSDEYNLVIARFKYNYVCISHYPQLPGELSVVPYSHVAALKDLLPEALRENIALAMALLPIMKDYAQKYIRECGGGNIYTKSMGNKASDKQKNKHHVHTRIMPRTIVPLTPGNYDSNSAKIDCDPRHLFPYLKNTTDELKKIVT